MCLDGHLASRDVIAWHRVWLVVTVSSGFKGVFARLQCYHGREIGLSNDCFFYSQLIVESSKLTAIKHSFN